MSTLCLALLCVAPGSQADDVEAVAREYAPLLTVEPGRALALDRLAHAGRAVLPALESAGIDPADLRSLRETVELHEALRDSYSGPRLFTFDGRPESLGTLLSRLETATGMTFHKHAVDLAAPHSLELRDATFWQALDALARKVPFAYHPYVGDQLYLNAGPAPSKPVSYHGPFRLALDRLVFQRRIGFDRTTEHVRARIHVLWETHVLPLGLTKRWEFSRAEDDSGASLLLPPDAESPPASPRPPASSRMPYEILDAGPLRPPAPGAKRLAVLEGTLEIEFPARVEKAVFEKPASGAAPSRPLEGVEVELRSFASAASPGILAEFALRFRDEKEAAAHRVGARDVTLVPLAGPAQAAQLAEVKVEKNVVSVSIRAYRLAAAREIREIVLRVPRGSRIMKVPFRFRDVELK